MIPRYNVLYGFGVCAVLLALACRVVTAEDVTRSQKLLPSLSEIEKAWQARAQKVETLYCSWKSSLEVPARSQFAQDPDSLTLNRIPANDFRFESERLLYIGVRDKLRFEDNGWAPIGPIQAFAPQKCIAVTDGEHAPRTFLEGDRTGEQRYAPLGFIRSGSEVFELLSLTNGGPLFFYCRPSAKVVRQFWSIENSRVLERIDAGNGQTLILIEEGEKPFLSQMYLDESRGFLPVQFIRKSLSPVTGEMFQTSQINIQYDDSPTFPAIMSWKTMGWRSEKDPSYNEFAKVVEFVVNPQIEEEQFRLDFPAGTKVIDSSSDKTEVYIVQANGLRRVVTEAERTSRTPYKTLLATDPQDLGDGANRPAFPWLLYVNVGAIVFLLFGYFLYRRRKKGLVDTL